MGGISDMKKMNGIFIAQLKRLEIRHAQDKTEGLVGAWGARGQ
jgi:hypothetical protein